MKRIKLLSIIWLLLLFLTGCGCSIETVDEHNRKADSEAYERSSALEELLSSKAAAIENSSTTVENKESSGETTVPARDTLSESTYDTTGNNTSSITSNSIDTDTSSETAIAPSSKGDEQTTVPPSAIQTTTVKDTESRDSSDTESDTTYEYILVHITITCSKAVGHKDLNTSADIPENGIFLDKDIAVKSGSSVYDALITALKDNNINYTENSGYITGINNLNEKECGKYSGWKFRVNNVYPNVGCSGYTLSDGDNILWGYVLSHTDIY